MSGMEPQVCSQHKFGLCKYQQSCKKLHFTETCSEWCLDIKECKKRYPKRCKFYLTNGFCLLKDCMYSHEKSRELQAIEDLNESILNTLEIHMHGVQTILQNFIESSCAPSLHYHKNDGLYGSKVPPQGVELSAKTAVKLPQNEKVMIDKPLSDKTSNTDHLNRKTPISREKGKCNKISEEANPDAGKDDKTKEAHREGLLVGGGVNENIGNTNSSRKTSAINYKELNRSGLKTSTNALRDKNIEKWLGNESRGMRKPTNKPEREGCPSSLDS